MIPFIRAFPSGEKRLQEIDRPAEIQVLANRFIAHGGRYLVAIHSDEKVELVAALGTSDGIRKVASETTPNGPEMIDAVDRLVKASVEGLDTVQ